MQQQVIEILSQSLEIPVEQIGQNFNKKTCENWDSIAHLTIIAELESAFDCSFEPEEMESIESLKDILAILEQKKG